MVARDGSKPWFGPRRLSGWGWAPVSTEGWIVTVVVLAGFFAPVPFLHGDSPSWVVAVFLAWTGVLCAATFAACYFKGTSPGGYRQRAAFDRHRRAAGDADSQ